METSTLQSKPPKTYSCVRCFERKVKCDKNSPCAGCIRSNLECVFRRPATPRRRQRKTTTADDALLARLKHCEDLLRLHGLDPAAQTSLIANPTPVSPPEDAYPSAATTPQGASSEHWEPGQLIIDQGRSRFFENKLWSTVSEEASVRHNKDVMPDSDSEDDTSTPADDAGDFLLGMTPSSNQTASLHPLPDHVLKLWQVFLSNVHPLTKILHQPSLEVTIRQATTDLEHVPRGLEALLFAIYGAAVFSMREGECQATFGESRPILLARYKLGARRALTKAKFMSTSNVVVLQAFVIYLLSVQQDLDAHTLWTLSGVATRIAQGMGVHQDGTTFGLSPFDTEMRCRLCWLVRKMDFKAAELTGVGFMKELNSWNGQLPSNLDDADLHPDMKELPPPKTGPTEMIMCLLRYELSSLLPQKLSQKMPGQQDVNQAVKNWVIGAPIPEKDAIIDELEVILHEKFIKHCDTGVPVQLLATIVARMMIDTMKIMTHHPRRYANEADVPEKEREMLWQRSMALIEADNLAHSYRSLQRFRWHIDFLFQWQAFILVLRELIARPFGPGKDDAWPQIEDAFKYHPEFTTDYKKPLHIAISGMCLKAWQARERAQLEDPQGSVWLDTPSFILQLRKRLEVGKGQAGNPYGDAFASPASLPDPMQLQPTSYFDTADVYSNWQIQEADSTFDVTMPQAAFLPMTDDTMMDWQSWDALLYDLRVPRGP